MKTCEHCRLQYPDDGDVCFLCGRTLSIAKDPLIGATLAGRYVVESVIGEGGMATVYAARHRLVDRSCAIKVMNETFANNEVIRERFRREAKAAQKLAHPNIIEIMDQGETPDGRLYLVMELLTGETLANRIQRGKVPLKEALPIASEIARALARAHDLEVIHRDLKPENIFLTEEEDDALRVKLLDFGIARSTRDSRLTGAGELFGTPEYMAPERVKSTDAGPSADVYALGVILYEMLAGSLPFDAEDPMSLLVKHVKEQPIPPRERDRSIPESAERLILELLAKDPKDRPVDAHRVHADLMAMAAELGIAMPRDITTGKLSSRRQPAKTLPPIAIDQWAQRTLVFDRMLKTAYPQGEARLAGLLGQVRKLVQEIGELRGQAIQEQRALEGVEARGREARERFGHAVDALGVDASHARDELKAAASEAARLREPARTPEGVLLATRDVMRWEGRSAFKVPYPELAKAYRTAADRVDEWVAAHGEYQKAEAAVERRKVVVDDIEFQIKELRAALASRQEELEREEAERQAAVGTMGARADDLEKKLLELATEFCAPLRALPALEGLFHELEGVAA